MKSWYLIYSKPRQERVARENLERQGFEVYLPLVAARRRRVGGRVTVLEPMFPRYLFIYLDDQLDDWGPIRSTLGVARLVRFGSVNAQVPQALICALRSQEDEDGVRVLPPRVLKPGERVRITEGAMAGYEAIFQARSGHERVLILLEMAGRQARVHVSEDAIEPLATFRSGPDGARR